MRLRTTLSHRTSLYVICSNLRRGVQKARAAVLLATMWVCVAYGQANIRALSGKAPDLDQQARSAYAPYWYIDESTDSYIEIKNHLDTPLSLSPVLTVMKGLRLKLHAITVPPFSSARVGLRSQPELRKLRSSTTGKSAARWGDGSRAKSLLGAAQLIPIRPKGSNAAAFSAWVLVEDPDERLGTVSLFEVPAEVINTVLAGLWWLPYPRTQAYYALQNTSSVRVDTRIELVANGKSLRTTSLKIPCRGMKLINVSELLETENAPAVGGIRITYKSGSRKTLPGQVIGRGRLLEEKVGFSASLMLHEYLGNTPGDSISELHAPAAYFGKLEALCGRSKAYLHPHLLLWNTRPYDITLNTSVYGRAKYGKAVEWRLPPLVLKARSPVELDLESQRQAANADLGDGPAGLRMIHTGNPTDVVAELINVDQEGKVVFYDAIRSTFLHGTPTQAAISFNLGDRNQAFLVVKNISDAPQPITIFLDYGDGKGHYQLTPEPVAAQQGRIVDIRNLRDKQIRDKNGLALPRNLDFGGASLLSEPGAFVVSDPSFIYTSQKPPADNRNDPKPDPEDPDDLNDRPFFVPSCARLTQPPECEPPRCSPPPPSYSRSPFPTPCNVMTPWSQTHRAIDVTSSTNRFGEEVDAMEGGTIESVGTRPAGDDFSAVVIRGDDGFLTVYGHVRPADGLTRGQTVQRGQPIGSTDNSGVFQLPGGGLGRCPDPAGRNCSHVHIARIKANLPLPNRETLSEILDRIRPRENGGLGEGDFFGIDCMSPQRLSRALGVWPYARD